MPHWNAKAVRVVSINKFDPALVVIAVVHCSGIEQRCARHFREDESPTLRATFHVHGVNNNSLARVTTPIELCFEDSTGEHYRFKIEPEFVVDRDTIIFTWKTGRSA